MHGSGDARLDFLEAQAALRAKSPTAAANREGKSHSTGSNGASAAGRATSSGARHPANATQAPGRSARATSWLLQVVAAAILGQTLFFKFSAAPESVAIFTALGAEPWGRIGSGLAELLAVILLLVPRTAVLGALLSLGVMGGAIASHVLFLGIAVTNSDGSSDGGLLFALAIVVAACSAAILAIRRRQIPVLGPALF